MAHEIVFTLNGSVQRVSGVAATTMLLDWLRARGLTGTKEGCAEGDCGACTTAMVDLDGRGRPTWRSFNACITPLSLLAGRTVVTVEGLADPEPHPAQRAMAEHHGSQCGYCTPGFVVSMFEGCMRDDLKEPWQLHDQLCGNLCRCTGYRPIRDAMRHALAAPASASERFRLPMVEPNAVVGAFEYAHDGTRLLRPDTVEALLALRAEHPDAALIAGATEIGVEANKKFRAFPLLISTEAVASLRRVERTATHWVIGGAATLTQVEEATAGALPTLDKMLRVFAARQVRNRATVAGNLVTASPIGDLAPVLLALDAEVELASVAGARVVPLAGFFTGYRATVMRRDEVMTAVRVPHAPEGVTRRAESYKVSKRRELDISIVAAAFSVDLDAQGVVRRARLAYGGVAATPSRALDAERALEGRPWSDARSILPTLAATFAPIRDARSGPDYRRDLVVSLFEKFVDGATSLSQDADLDFAPSDTWPVDDASKGLRHESALGHATGRARYVDDEAQRRPSLTLWPVCAPHARARVLRRDATKARAMPGVAAVLMAEDVPGVNDVGAVRHDEVLLAYDEVSFHGHPVAVVVADTDDNARRAAMAVEVEYEPLPAIVGVKAAIAAGSYHTEPSRIRRGDAQAALASAPYTLSGELLIGGQEHFYLESHAAWAEVGEEGDLFVASSTQHPSEIQAVVAHVVGLPRNRVVVQSPRMGGGFGGKETQGNTWAALVALAAVKTGETVRVQLDRDLDMALTGKRHPFHAEYRVGFDGDGHLLALDARLTSDGGWALDLSEAICDRALFHVDNAYYIPNVDVVGRVAKTNVTSHTAFRGFGGPQGMVVIEEALDRVARALDLAPELVRARNLYGSEGRDTTHYGQRVEANRLPVIWPRLLASSEFESRRAEVDRFNASSPRVKRGLAVTPVKFGISFTATFLNQAGALVVLYRDGSAQVNHGGTEMGQGLHTKVQGVVMRELGLSRGRVRMMKTTTDKVPNTSATAASAGADLNGAAVRAACATLRERLAPVAAALLGVPEGDFVFEGDKVSTRDGAASVPIEKVTETAYLWQVPLSATGFYKTPGIGWDRAKGEGKPFHYFAFGAAVSEVEVDGYSGMKKVLRVDILHDVGDSLNPGIDRGQVEGGFVQGVGWLTGEELLWDPAGRLLTHSASTYQIPSIGDAPVDLRVALLPDAAQASTIHGSKAVGEPPLMLAISVREAIRDAVAAFGAPGGDVPLACPSTHEAIFAAVKARRAAETSRDESAA